MTVNLNSLNENMVGLLFENGVEEALLDTLSLQSL